MARMTAERLTEIKQHYAVWSDTAIPRELLTEIEALKQEVAIAHKALASQERHGKPCYYCGKPVNDLSARPSELGIPLCHPDDPGVVKWHHIGCVSERLEQLAETRKDTERLDWIAHRCTLARFSVLITNNCGPSFRAAIDAARSGE